MVFRLTEHTSDVAGLEWSPDGRWLASCGLDGSIIIWDVQGGFKFVTRLEGHKGFVKGLAWDPLGVFLVSQSDDHSMIVWRCQDWQLETQLKKPFDQGHEETFFRRPSWSPDGQFIAAANAVNGRQPVISLISRDQWKSEVAFVGHLLAVEVARFSPFLYNRPGAAEKPGYLCAAGSQDCNTSIWTDTNSKPLAVLTDLFEHAVMDLEWLPDGLSMIVAAYDGTIAKVIFSPALVGTPLMEREKAEFLASLQKGKEASAISEFPCSVTQVQLQSELNSVMKDLPSQDVEMTLAPLQAPVCVPVMTAPAAPSPFVVPMTTTAAPVRQVETKTKEGKRRVAPILMTSEPTGSYGTSAPINTAPAAPTASTGMIATLAVEPVCLKGASVAKRLVSLDGLVEVTNTKAIGGLKGETKIRFLSRPGAEDKNAVLWEDRLEAHVLFLEATGNAVVCASQNSTVLVFSPIGRRLCPPLIVQGGIVGLGAKGDIIAVLTDCGRFNIWNVAQMISVANGSLSSIAKNGAVTGLKILSPEGSFRLSFSDGRSYEYVARMQCFVQVSGGIFHSLEYETNMPADSVDKLVLLKQALSVNLQDGRNHSVASLESRLSLAALQGDLLAFGHLLATYIRRLVAEGLVDKTFETLTGIKQRLNWPWLQANTAELLHMVRPLLAGLPGADLLLAEIFDTP